MIRTYTDPLIAISKRADRSKEDTKHTIVIAEAVLAGLNPKEVAIHFYGALADEVLERLVPGMKFTYRGFIALDGEKLILVGQSFAPIA